jgi:hypothetical protein
LWVVPVSGGSDEGRKMTAFDLGVSKARLMVKYFYSILKFYIHTPSQPDTVSVIPLKRQRCVAFLRY